MFEIEDIESNNKDVKSLTTYEVSLKDIKNDLINNHKRINKLEDKKGLHWGKDGENSISSQKFI
jgi:hypothetical protein